MKKDWVIYLFTWPVDVLTWLLVLVMWLFWGHELEWKRGVWFRLKPNSWPTRTWYKVKINGEYMAVPEQYQERLGKCLTWGGTTFGHGGFYGPGANERTKYHEQIHVEQFEVIMVTVTLLALSVGITGSIWGGPEWAWITACGLWVMGWLLKAVSGWLVAWLRGEPAYLGSEHEESAYAQTAEKFED